MPSISITHTTSDAEVVGRRLLHDAAAGAEEMTKRLDALYDMVVDAATENRLDSALAYADTSRRSVSSRETPDPDVDHRSG